MAECVVPPAVGVGILLTIFYCDVDTVVLAVEVSTSGRFGAGAVWKLRIKDPREFFYYDRSFWHVARFQIRINVFLLDVYMMIFGEVGSGAVLSGRVAVILSIVEALGSKGSANKNPFTKAGWQLHPALRIKYRTCLRRLRFNWSNVTTRLRCLSFNNSRFN